MENVVNTSDDRVPVCTEQTTGGSPMAFLRQTQDHYRFIVGDIAVKVSFARTEKTLSDCLLSALGSS